MRLLQSIYQHCGVKKYIGIKFQLITFSHTPSPSHDAQTDSTCCTKKRCTLHKKPVHEEPQQQSVIVASGNDLFAGWPE
jgi:hypothetical protein